MSQTPNLGLNKPAEGELNWASAINENWDTLDSKMAPTVATIWGHERVVLVGNAININVMTSQAFNCRPYQNPAADGDSCLSRFYLAAGEYKMRVLGGTGNSFGLVDWYIDDVKVVSLEDWYSASTGYNVEKTSTVTVSGSGMHTLKSVINGKNVSSTSYVLVVTKIDFRPSTD